MELTFDITPLYELGEKDTLSIMWQIFLSGGWILFALFALWALYYLWHFRRSMKWFKSFKYVMLAIDIPKDTEQTPKAVEQLFATVSGAHMPLSAKEIKLLGMFQLAFQFEIISIDGYVQFLIRTPEQWRDLIESSIYAQYPDAEITEVEDYIDEVPTKYPSDTHNIWGTEVILARKDVYPIRTYKHFEDSVSGEFKDPLAALLETMSKIRKGEQVWIQIIVRPTGYEWIKRSKIEAHKLAGKKIKPQDGLIARLIKPITDLFFLSTGEPMFIPEAGAAQPSQQKRDDLPSMMLHLTPGEKGAIEAIEEKASKNGFQCKIRLIYIATHENYQVARVVSPVFGAIKQFNTLDLNAFKPDPKTKTTVMYFFIKSRQAWRRTRLMSAYKARSGLVGHGYFILNNEELATLWHFPDKYTKVPLLQKTETKTASAPATLPIELEETLTEEASLELRQQLKAATSDFDVDMQNKQFERKFAKDKSAVKPSIKKGDAPSNLPISE